MGAPKHRQLENAPKITFLPGAAPATPSAGKTEVYVNTSNKLASKDDTGAETVYGTGGAGSFGDTPIGGIIPFGGPISAVPEGWLPCDGQEYDETVEAALFAVIGTAWNTGGETGGFFRVPDARARSFAGINDVTLPNGADGGRTTRNVGNTSGAENHTHPVTSQVGHAHGLTVNAGGLHDHTVDVAAGLGTKRFQQANPGFDLIGGAGGGSHTHTGTTVANAAHNHGGATGSGSGIGPTAFMPYIIKATDTSALGSSNLTTLVNGVATQVLAVEMADGEVHGLKLDYTVEMADASVSQCEVGTVLIPLVDLVGGVTAGTPLKTSSQAIPSGSLSCVFTANPADDGSIEILLAATSNLTTTTSTVRWASTPISGSGTVNTFPVDSVFGRTGPVVAAASDYDASQVDNDSTVTGTTVKDALETLEAAAAVPGYELIASAQTAASGNLSLAIPAGALAADGDHLLLVISAVVLVSNVGWTIRLNGTAISPGNNFSANTRINNTAHVYRTGASAQLCFSRQTVSTSDLTHGGIVTAFSNAGVLTFDTNVIVGSVANLYIQSAKVFKVRI